MKVTHELALAGNLNLLRGRNGGLRLAKPATEINVGHVMRLTESGSALVECFDPATNQCVITPACKLKHVLHDALEAFFRTLEQTTLADLIVIRGGCRRSISPKPRRFTRPVKLPHRGHFLKDALESILL